VSGGGAGALLVSTFNMEWRCYVHAGGVDESKFCLFSVVFPARCNSSISPRFYFRRHVFCFLLLATILESLSLSLSSVLHIITPGLNLFVSFPPLLTAQVQGV
jgi:hypothetical protein